MRRQVDDSLRRLGIERIDLLQLHNPDMAPIVDDELWETFESLRAEGKVRELGVSLGPAIGWIEEGIHAVEERPIATLQTVFNVLEQEPGRTFAACDPVRSGNVSLLSRVPHASGGRKNRDDLVGDRIADDVFVVYMSENVAAINRHHVDDSDGDGRELPSRRQAHAD